MNLTYEQRAKLDRLRIGIESNQWGKDELINMRSQFAARKSAFNELRIEMVEKALAGSKPEMPEMEPAPVPETNIDEYVARKYLQLSQNAKARGLEFGLTLDDIKALLTEERCYYTGWKFSKSSPETSLSFDRRDNKQGYVAGNVVACMSMINSLKNQLVESRDAPFKDNPELLTEVVAKWVAPAPPVKFSLWSRVLKALLPEAALPQQQTENAL